MSWTHDDLISKQPALWHIHRTQGPYATAWNEFRIYGPLSTARWDPHPLPVAEHAATGVLYAAADVETAVAEVFQQYRRVDPVTDSRHATSWTPTRPLTLLDLTQGWLVRMGAAAALMHADDKEPGRNWARAIHEKAAGSLDGLWVNSTMTNAGMPVLFEPSRDSFPERPGFSTALDAAGTFTLIDGMLPTINYKWTIPS